MKSFDEEWRRRFERFAREHAEEHSVSGWSDHGLRSRVALFEELLATRVIARSAKVLDLGCGAGTYVRLLAKQGHRVVGVDYSLPTLRRALEADPERRGRYLAGNAYHLPFRDGSFDLVVSIGILQASSEPERTLDEMHRVLRAGGILVVEFLNAEEIIARLRSAKGRFLGKPPRVRTYPPSEVSRWFDDRGLDTVCRAGVYIPPRNMPSLGRFIGRAGVVRLLERIPFLSNATAHAYLVLGVKPEKGTTVLPVRE